MTGAPSWAGHARIGLDALAAGGDDVVARILRLRRTASAHDSPAAALRHFADPARFFSVLQRHPGAPFIM